MERTTKNDHDRSVVVKRFNDLGTDEARELLGLTLSITRNDHRDEDEGCLVDTGSAFKDMLQRHIDGWLADSHRWVIIVKDMGVPIAWCMVENTSHDPATGRPTHVCSAELGFYVDPAHRREALGTFLFARACSLARELGMHRLFAFPWNVSSSSFFNRNGFEEVMSYREPFRSYGVAFIDVFGDAPSANNT